MVTVSGATIGWTVYICGLERGLRGRDSSVGTATRYGLGGPGIESRWGRDLPHLYRPALGPTQTPTQWLKRSGRGVDHSSPSSSEVEERVKLYIYTPYGPSWRDLG